MGKSRDTRSFFFKYWVPGRAQTTVSCFFRSCRRPPSVAAGGAELSARPPNDDDGVVAAVVVVDAAAAADACAGCCCWVVVGERWPRPRTVAVVFRESSRQLQPRPSVSSSATRTHRPPATVGKSTRIWPASWPGSTTPSPVRIRSTGVRRRSPFPPGATCTPSPLALPEQSSCHPHQSAQNNRRIKIKFSALL